MFGKPAIVTDTHCIRLVNRMGLVDGIKEPKKVEMALWKLIPPEESNDFATGSWITGARSVPNGQRHTATAAVSMTSAKGRNLEKIK